MNVMQNMLTISPGAPPAIVQGVPVSAVQISESSLAVFSVPEPNMPTIWRVFTVPGMGGYVPDGARHVATVAHRPPHLAELPGVMPVIVHVFAEPT